MTTPIDRTLPNAGMSPIDGYIKDDRPAGFFEQIVTLPNTTEVNCVKVVGTPTMISAGNYAGLRVEVAPVGTAGGWAAGIYSKVTQDSTKRINGYLCAGEFELINSADNASAMAVLTLNWNNSSSSPGVPGGSTQAYIQLRDYSSGTPCSALFEFTDITVGSADATSLICEMGSATSASHVIRITVKNTPYWILMDSTPPA